MRSVLGGDDENEMQGSNLDGSDVKQEGEEELRKKREKKGSLAGAWSGRWGDVIWAVGRHDLSWPELGWGELGDEFWIVWGVCLSSLSSGVVSRKCLKVKSKRKWLYAFSGLFYGQWVAKFPFDRIFCGYQKHPRV